MDFDFNEFDSFEPHEFDTYDLGKLTSCGKGSSEPKAIKSKAKLSKDVPKTVKSRTPRSSIARTSSAARMQAHEIIEECMSPEDSILPSWRSTDKLTYRIAQRAGHPILPRMFIHLQLKLRKRLGDAIEPTSLEDLCAVICLPGMLLCSPQVSFNNVIVSRASTAQMYATYLRALLAYQPAQRKGLFNDAAFWKPDNPVRSEECQVPQANENHFHRAVHLANDGILELYAPLMSDILLQSSLIPDNVSINIILARNAHTFCFNVQSNETDANVIYELGIMRADLYIKRLQCAVHVQPPLSKASVKLLYSAYDTRMYFFERNTTQLCARVLHEAVLPSRFFALQLRKDAFDWNYQRNALSIQFNDASKASLFLSGIARLLQCYDFGGHDRLQPSKRAYFDVMHALDADLAESIVSFLEFISSSFILAWDLRSLANAHGSLELRIDLYSPLEQYTVVIGCFIYERELTCHSNGEISRD